MNRIILLAFFVTMTAVWAQDATTEDPAATAAETETEEEYSVDELDDFDLDSQADHTEEDEDVFKPTDVVSYTQSVPFPVDI